MSRSYGDGRILPLPEIVTRRSRLSPSEDLKLRTLSALRGVWSKLLYMSELRLPNGKYDHWGLIRAHGEKQSQEALAAVHSEIYIELLRSPLRQLISGSPEADLTNWEQRLCQIRNDVAQMIPEDPSGGSPRHFSSIVLAASLLVADRAACRRPSA